MAEPQHSFEENPFLGYQVTGALLRECRKEFGEEAPDCRRLEKARVYYFSQAQCPHQCNKLISCVKDNGASKCSADESALLQCIDEKFTEMNREAPS